MRRALVGLLVLVACGGDKTDGSVSGSNAPVTSSPLPASSPDEEAVERGIRSIAAISDLATKHGANCEALALDLGAYAKREAPTLAAFKKILGDPAKQQAMTAKFGERIQQVAQATVVTLREHCASHPAVQQLFKALQ